MTQISGTQNKSTHTPFERVRTLHRVYNETQKHTHLCRTRALFELLCQLLKHSKRFAVSGKICRIQEHSTSQILFFPSTLAPTHSIFQILFFQCTLFFQIIFFPSTVFPPDALSQKLFPHTPFQKCSHTFESKHEVLHKLPHTFGSKLTPFFKIGICLSVTDACLNATQTLLQDNSTLVIGSAIAAFQEVCPERADLLHPNIRKLCRLCADTDEWGQIIILTVLTRCVEVRMCACFQVSTSDAVHQRASTCINVRVHVCVRVQTSTAVPAVCDSHESARSF